MRAVFVVFNQALSDQVADAIAKVGLRGFTRWTAVQGCGSDTGEPHLGTHTWPSVNTATLLVTDEASAGELVQRLDALNAASPKQGLRVFGWDVEALV